MDIIVEDFTLYQNFRLTDVAMWNIGMSSRTAPLPMKAMKHHPSTNRNIIFASVWDKSRETWANSQKLTQM